QQIDRLADHSAAAHLMPEPVVAVDADAAGSGDASGRSRKFEQLETDRTRKELRRVVVGNRIDRRRERQAGASRALQDRVLQTGLAIGAAKPIARIVADAALLAAAGQRFEDSAIGIDAKVTVAQRDFFACLMACDLTAEQPARAINPAIESGGHTVDAGLIILGPKA